MDWKGFLTPYAPQTMNEKIICTSIEEAEAFFEHLAFKHELLKKEVFGRVVNKVIRDRDVRIDRRYFSFTGNKYLFLAYAFSKDPLDVSAPMQLRGKLMRLDFIAAESKRKEKPKSRYFQGEVMYGLGYKTPIDEDSHFYWGQMGCMGEFPSRVQKSQFEGDLDGSLKRMSLFDKNALIAGQIVTWNPKSGQGTIDTAIRKKVFIKTSDLPKEIKKPRKGIKLRLRLLNDGGQLRCSNALPG